MKSLASFYMLFTWALPPVVRAASDPPVGRSRKLRMVCRLESIVIGGAPLATRGTEARRRARVMQMFVIGGNWRRTVTRAVIAGTLAASLVTLGTGSVCRADDEPKPDPAGIATGDRASVYDAGGTAFVRRRADGQDGGGLRQKKKDFDEYTGAGRARSRWRRSWPTRSATCASRRTSRGRSTPATSCSSCRPGSRCSPAAWCERRTPAT